jgi:hypothetical protein
MKLFRVSFACTLCIAAVLGSAFSLAAAERLTPARLSAARDAFSDADRRAFVAWALAQREVRAQTVGHRTRVLRVWSEAAKTDAGAVRRATVLLRDYDAGIAREITADLPKGPVRIRELHGVQPSEVEIEEGMAIVRGDPALAQFVENRELLLIGGFHNRSLDRDDPCSRDVCLEFAFQRGNYEGPARYVIVDLSRRVVAHHDFRGSKAAGVPPRMTEGTVP